MTKDDWLRIAQILSTLIGPLLAGYVVWRINRAALNPDRNTQQTNRPITNKPPTIWGFVKEHKLIAACQWVVFASFIQLLVSMLLGFVPPNFNAFLALIYSLASLVLVTILLFRR